MRTWKVEMSGNQKIGKPKLRKSREMLYNKTWRQEYREKKNKTEAFG